MYIEPNTTVKILKNCPLDKTYEHTIYFDTKSAQYNYFNTLTKYTLNNQTYQRVKRGYIRVQYKADDLYDCNYIMFQNSSFGDRWFYAFIKSVEYVNNITSQVEFELDVMQTWAFDYNLEQCFVEREHSITDNIGDNIVPENIELGEYVSSSFDDSGVLRGFSIVVAATFDSNFNDVGGALYSGLFAGVYYHVFDNSRSGAAACEEFLIEATERNKAYGIIAVFLMKSAMVSEMGDPPQYYEETFQPNYDNIDGYVPYNKKLFTYPYNFLYVTNLQGNAAEYKYEFFSGSSCTFGITGDMSPNPSILLFPLNYKGVNANYDEKLVLSGFPQLPYNIDSFKAWLAQSQGTLAINALSIASSGVQGAIAGGAMAGPAGAAAGALTGAGMQVANVVAQVYQHSTIPPQAKGGSGSISLAAAGVLDFAFMRKHVSFQFARIIDDYFNVYGYATHRVKTPNRNVRPHWTYTKTVSCVINGSVPADDAATICAIYNNGITFWRNGNEVGHYFLDNSP